MGGKFSRKPGLPYNPFDYEQVHSQLRQDTQSYRVLKHIRTGIEMEEYKLQFNDEQEFLEYYDAFQWRLTQEFVVNTIYFVENNRKEFCSTHYGAFLYTERIPIKLSDIKDIPYPDNLYILQASLEGFHTVYHKTGFFEIQEHMVCINRQGKVKIWINDNLSKKYPESIYTQTDGTEQDMVSRLLELIDENTDSASQPIPVPEFFLKYGQHVNFNDAKMLLRQYSKTYSVDIPKSFECILQVLNSDQVDDFRVIQGSRRTSSIHSADIRMKSMQDKENNSIVDVSNRSFQQDYVEMPKHVVRVDANRQSRASQAHAIMQSRQSSGMGVIVMPSLSPNMHKPKQQQQQAYYQGAMPMMNQPRPIIQHLHYPMVNAVPKTTSAIPIQVIVQPHHIGHYNSPSQATLNRNEQFHARNQQPQTIISPVPSQELISHHSQRKMHSQGQSMRSSNRKLDVYAEQDDWQQPAPQHQGQSSNRRQNNNAASNRSSRKQSLSQHSRHSQTSHSSQQQRRRHYADSQSQQSQATEQQYPRQRRRQNRPAIAQAPHDSSSSEQRQRNSRKRKDRKFKEERTWFIRQREEQRRLEEEDRIEDERRIADEELRRQQEIYERRRKDDQERRWKEEAQHRKMLQDRERRVTEELDRRKREVEGYLRQEEEWLRNRRKEEDDARKRREQQIQNTSSARITNGMHQQSYHQNYNEQDETREPRYQNQRIPRSNSGLNSANSSFRNFHSSSRDINKIVRQAPLVYHSTDDDHELDPEIARDLMALQL